MSTHYFDSTSGGNQYYFNSSDATTSQSHQNYSSSATPSYGTPTYSSYPVSRSSNQQIRLNDSFQMPQSYQSTGGFNKSIIQQHYQSPQSPPPPQVRASVRVVGSQDTYQLQSSPQRSQASPQHHHFQFDSRQQAGRSTGPAVVYQTPGAAQYTHHNVDLWTESPSHSPDYHVQAQRVSVRPVSTGSPQQSHSISPQQYYSQLTPEQHQQLLRQQQIQRQQEQNSSYEQQRRVTVQQVSPSSSSYQQQKQQHSTANFTGGQQSQQGRSRSESERQRQNEQDYYSAQRQMASQRGQEYDDESSRPVGIRNLMSKFSAISGQPRQPRSRSTSSRHYSSSGYATHPTSNQTTTTRTFTSHSMTYSALPKSHEPPVNSVEFLQMQQLMGNSFNNIQQAVAPPHIQLAHADPGSMRDRFKTGSLSDDFNRTQMMNRQPQPQPPKQVQRQTSNDGGSTLSSLRNQYMTRTKESLQDDLPPQPAYNISRSIIGEDIPRPKQQQQAPLQMQSPPQVLQKQSNSAPQQQQQQSAFEPQPSDQNQSPQQQNENADQQASETAPPPPANDAELAVSSF